MNCGYAPFMRPMPGYYNPIMPNVPQQGQDIQNFQQQPYQQSSMNVAQNQQADGSMIWVLGKNEAESYPVAPNCQVVLWDKDAPTLYVKSMSANGVPNMRILDFTERTETVQNQPASNENDLNNKFVGIADFNALREEFDELRLKYNELERMQNVKTVEKITKSDKKMKGCDE